MNENANAIKTNPAAADAALGVWLAMWNTNGGIARRICTEDFRIHFVMSNADGSNRGDDPGADVSGAQSFARFLDQYREQHPDVVFTENARSVDGAHGRMLWHVRDGNLAAGGIDVFDFTEDGLIREVWSVTGTRMHLT